MTLITGLISIVMVAVYLGILLWWIKAPPLIIICLIVFGFIVYDFVKTMREEKRG